NLPDEWSRLKHLRPDILGLSCVGTAAYCRATIWQPDCSNQVAKVVAETFCPGEVDHDSRYEARPNSNIEGLRAGRCGQRPCHYADPWLLDEELCTFADRTTDSANQRAGCQDGSGPPQYSGHRPACAGGH